MASLERKIKAMLNYVSGGRLPSEYQEVEWIGSPTANNYIDLNVQQIYTTEFIYDGTYKSGRCGTINPNRFYFMNNGAWGCGLGGSFNHNISRSDNNRHIFYLGNNMFMVDDNILYQATMSNTNANIYLFATCYTNYANNFGTGECYGCKVKENGTLVRDLIPCYRKADTEIGLYDLVNDTFYTNAGTGTFTKGADV